MGQTPMGRQRMADESPNKTAVTEPPPPYSFEAWFAKYCEDFDVDEDPGTISAMRVAYEAGMTACWVAIAQSKKELDELLRTRKL